MKNIKYYFFLLLFFIVGWIGRSQDNDYDIAFVKDAAISGLFEVQLGKLAMTKSVLPEVKAFGQKMVSDHGSAHQELKELAMKKNISLPDSLDAKKKAVYDSVALKKGRAFDEEYIKQMRRAHDIDVNKFEAATKSLVDADLRAWAAKTLPTLKLHQKHIKEMKIAEKNDKKENKDNKGNNNRNEKDKSKKTS